MTSSQMSWRALKMHSKNLWCRLRNFKRGCKGPLHPPTYQMVGIIYVTKEETPIMVEYEVHVDMQVLEEETFKQEGD